MRKAVNELYVMPLKARVDPTSLNDEEQALYTRGLDKKLRTILRLAPKHVFEMAEFMDHAVQKIQQDDDRLRQNAEENARLKGITTDLKGELQEWKLESATYKRLHDQDLEAMMNVWIKREARNKGESDYKKSLEEFEKHWHRNHENYFYAREAAKPRSPSFDGAPSEHPQIEPHRSTGISSGVIAAHSGRSSSQGGPGETGGSTMAMSGGGVQEPHRVMSPPSLSPQAQSRGQGALRNPAEFDNSLAGPAKTPIKRKPSESPPERSSRSTSNKKRSGNQSGNHGFHAPQETDSPSIMGYHPPDYNGRVPSREQHPSGDQYLSGERQSSGNHGGSYGQPLHREPPPYDMVNRYGGSPWENSAPEESTMYPPGQGTFASQPQNTSRSEAHHQAVDSQASYGYHPMERGYEDPMVQHQQRDNHPSQARSMSGSQSQRPQPWIPAPPFWSPNMGQSDPNPMAQNQQQDNRPAQARSMRGGQSQISQPRIEAPPFWSLAMERGYPNPMAQHQDRDNCPAQGRSMSGGQNQRSQPWDLDRSSNQPPMTSVGRDNANSAGQHQQRNNCPAHPRSMIGDQNQALQPWNQNHSSNQPPMTSVGRDNAHSAGQHQQRNNRPAQTWSMSGGQNQSFQPSNQDHRSTQTAITAAGRDISHPAGQQHQPGQSQRQSTSTTRGGNTIVDADDIPASDVGPTAHRQPQEQHPITRSQTISRSRGESRPPVPPQVLPPTTRGGPRTRVDATTDNNNSNQQTGETPLQGEPSTTSHRGQEVEFEDEDAEASDDSNIWIMDLADFVRPGDVVFPEDPELDPAARENATVDASAASHRALPNPNPTLTTTTAAPARQGARQGKKTPKKARREVSESVTPPSETSSQQKRKFIASLPYEYQPASQSTHGGCMTSESDSD